MKVNYKEIFKLKTMLDAENIDYEFYDRSITNMKDEFNKLHFQIIIYKDKDKKQRLISVIEGTYTFGSEQDKLEIMGCLTEDEEKFDSVVGYLTAEEVFNRIIKNIDDR